MATRASRTRPGSPSLSIFVEASCNKALAKVGGSLNQIRRDVGVLNQHLKLTRLGWIEMHTHIIHHDRQGWNTVSAQAFRTYEPVLDFSGRDTAALETVRKAGRRTGLPDQGGITLPQRARANTPRPGIRRRAAAVPQQPVKCRPLPLSNAENGRGPPVTINQ